MFYVYEITTPANTPASNPKETIAKLVRGVIHRVEIRFPPGPAGLLHVQIWRGGHQIYPSVTGQSFASDDETIAFDDFYELYHHPTYLRILTWNEDEYYPHTVRVRIGVLPKYVVDPRLMFEDLRNKLTILLRRIGAI